MRINKLKTGLTIVILAAVMVSGCAGKENVPENAVTDTPTPTPAEEMDESKMRVGTVVPDAFLETEEEDYVERDFTISEKPFLKAVGKELRDDQGNGQLVQLKGTNVGGWFLQEFWMTTTNYSGNVTAESDVYRVLTERFGKEQAEILINAYQENFFTIEDFDYIAGLGVNCLRLPLWYRNFVDEEGNLYENAFDRVDWFVEEAGKRGIYVVIDMHGAPGSQNGSDHSGKDGKDNKMEASEFFFGDEETVKQNQDLFYRLWEKIAEHYNGEPWVAGYDLLNEPYCTYRYNTPYSDKVLRETLWDIYDEAYKRIRAIDPDHIIMMEATWDPVDLPNPTVYGWENVVYQYHTYMYDDYNNEKGKQISNLRKKLTDIKKANYDVPSYLGEFTLFDNKDAWDKGLKLLNDSGISWTTWTYKTITGLGNWSLKRQKNYNVNIESNDFDTIKNAWEKGSAFVSDNTTLALLLEKYYKQEYKTPVK